MARGGIRADAPPCARPICLLLNLVLISGSRCGWYVLQEKNAKKGIYILTCNDDMEAGSFLGSDKTKNDKKKASAQAYVSFLSVSAGACNCVLLVVVFLSAYSCCWFVA